MPRNQTDKKRTPNHRSIETLNRKSAPALGLDDLIQGFERLGLSAGDNVVVHSSLSSFGKVDGGADTVIDALEAVITDAGTLVMPTFSGQVVYVLEALALRSGLHGTGGSGTGPIYSGTLTDLWIAIRELSDEAGIATPFTSEEVLQDRLWGESKNLKRWGITLNKTDAMGSSWVGIRRAGPPIPENDVAPGKMPVWTGMIPETFWRRSETIHSTQYSGSFAAWGRFAEPLLLGHNNRPGQTHEEHPLNRLKMAGGRVLLLGVDHTSNSTIHVAQWFAVRNAGIQLPDGTEEFMENFQDVDEPMDTNSGQRRTQIGFADIRLADTTCLYEVVADLLAKKLVKEGAS